jgi:hypothetical protein
MKSSLLPAIAAALSGSLAGGLHLYLRFLNNTQDEMCNAHGHIDLPYAALLFFAAFVPVCLAVFVTSFIFVRLVKVAVKRMRES